MSLQTGRWTADPYEPAAAARLSDELGLSGAAASILARRGLGDPADARAFLEGSHRSDPARLPGARDACELVLRHVAQGSRITVFGDYDVDGVCSTAVMLSALRALGADPAWQLPSREEGYGLSQDAIRALAAAGTQLLVTVDCGVTAVAEVALARELGIEVLVTDHHRPGHELPDCVLVHPALEGGDPAAAELCAAGVALKLSEALRAAAGLDTAGAEEDDLDLAGLATVCDMVPLTGENRRIAREGMDAIARTRRPGLRALMEVAQLDPGQVDARAAGFRLGPRINAAGRLSRADGALELMLTTDPERAAEVARELDGLNHDRRETEQRILHEAEAKAAGQVARGAIVVAGEGWHPGVVGIVASRLVERFRRPCVVIALDEHGNGRGSGRSIAAYDLHAGLTAVSAHLSRFGGHRMAAGMEVEAANLEPFARALAAHAGAQLSPEDLISVQRVDAVVSGADLGLPLAEELERLGPFGAGNREPVLLVPAARIEHVTAMGEERNHARFSLASGGHRARGVAFRTTQKALSDAGAHPQDAAVALEQNRYNGTVEPRVVLRCLSATAEGALHDLGGKPFWDAVEAELGADPSAWWPDLDVGSGERTVRDLTDSGGFAALATDLVASRSGPVLVVVADVERRRRALEATVAGAAPGGLAAASWEALGAHPSLARPFTHLLALDPPPCASGTDLLRAAPGDGMAHLAWGAPEREFALAHWGAQLDIRPPMAQLWRTLRDGPLEGEALESALRGDGAFPRGGALAGRVLRVLGELGLVEFDLATRSVKPLEAARTDLEHSPAARAYAERLARLRDEAGGHPAAVVRAS